jgi:hypothetical protein
LKIFTLSESTSARPPEVGLQVCYDFHICTVIIYMLGWFVLMSSISCFIVTYALFRGLCGSSAFFSSILRTLNKRHLSQPANHLPNSGIPGNKEADRQANAARERRGSTVREEAFTSAANRARRITEQRAAAKAEWEERRLSKHYGYRDGKAGSRRPVPMKSRKSLASRYYQLKCGHAPTATYLKRFGQRDDDQC